MAYTAQQMASMFDSIKPIDPFEMYNQYAQIQSNQQQNQIRQMQMEEAQRKADVQTKMSEALASGMPLDQALKVGEDIYTQAGDLVSALDLKTKSQNLSDNSDMKDTQMAQSIIAWGKIDKGVAQSIYDKTLADKFGPKDLSQVDFNQNILRSIGGGGFISYDPDNPEGYTTLRQPRAPGGDGSGLKTNAIQLQKPDGSIVWVDPRTGNEVPGLNRWSEQGYKKTEDPMAPFKRAMAEQMMQSMTPQGAGYSAPSVPLTQVPQTPRVRQLIPRAGVAGN